mmetsp:Transcript_33225/g.87370  ORF Transcript_33225/g.87370 Transcript_33225/m.87370 type:complete len:247 (+) Transcript_33225:68-808(+)
MRVIIALVCFWACRVEPMSVIRSPHVMAATLCSGGVHTEENFIPPQLVIELRQEVRRLQGEGRFKTGTSHMSDGRQDMLRSANTCTPDMESDAFIVLYDKLDTVRASLGPPLGREHAAGMEAVYVVYPPGGYYRSHLDSVAGVDMAGSGCRSVSFICYLAENGWTESDGGALRVHGQLPPELDRWDDDEWEDDTDQNLRSIDILPNNGRLVLFDSKIVRHEVLPTMRERVCIVGWFRNSVCDAPVA